MSFFVGKEFPERLVCQILNKCSLKHRVKDNVQTFNRVHK